MSSETEIERLIIRLMGDGTAYQKMLEQATTVTDQLGQEMKRLGGTEAEFSAITARAAKVTEDATQALGRHNWEQRRLQGLLDVGRISEESYERQVAKTGSVLDTATGALTRHAAAVARGLVITKSSETATEGYKRQIAELDKLFVMTAITQEAYNRTAEDLNNKLPRTIALEKERAFAVRATANALREAGVVSARAAAQAQKEYAASERQLTAAIREGAAAERAMVKQDHIRVLKEARYATIAQATAERELANVRKEQEALTRSVMTAQERYTAAVANANRICAGNASLEQTRLRAIAAAQKALQDATVVTRNYGREISRAGLSMRGFGTSWSIYVSAPLGAFLTASTMAGVKMDSLTRGLTAITHSSAKTKKQLEDMLEVAKLPGLGFKEAVEGHIRLQATGFAATTSKRALLAFGNALATVGKGKADLDGVVLALTQIAAKGKVMAQEINQLGERVPQIRKIMEEAFGTADTEKIQKMGLSSQEFIEMIVTELEKLPKVTGGALNDLENFSDAAFIAFSKVGESILTVLRPAIISATDWVAYLGDAFKHLSTPTQLVILGMAGVATAIGPIAIIAGQATIAVGGLISALSYLTASVPGLLLVVGILNAALVGLVLAGVIYATYELTGMGRVMQELNIEMEESSRLSQEVADSMSKVAREALAVADALEGVAKTDFLKAKMDEANKTLVTYANRLEDAKDKLLAMQVTQEALDKFGGAGQGLLNYLRNIGNVTEATSQLEQATKQYDAQLKIVEETSKKLAATSLGQSELDRIKAQTALTKETDNYSKSLERKIEVLARGEAITKLNSLADRHAAMGMKFNREEIEKLIEKEQELKDLKAKKAAGVDLAKDVDTLTKKMEAQVATFGMAKEADDIFALAERGASDASLASARALSEKLKVLKDNETATKKAAKETADLAKDITTFTDKLRSEIATFGMLSEEAEIYALKARGATDSELIFARALAASKKEMTDNKKLMEDGLKITEKRQPLTKFTNDYRELAKMLSVGAISADTFKLEVADLEKELAAAQEKADVSVKFSVEGNEAVRAGSAEFTKMLADVERRTNGLKFGTNVRDMERAINSEFTKVEPEIPTVTVATIIADEIEPTHTFTVDAGTEMFTVDDGGEKTVPVLERIATGIDEMARRAVVVLSEIGAGG